MINADMPDPTTADTAALHPMLELLGDAADGYIEFQRGDVVNGAIAWVGENEILIDVGSKFEGVLAPQEFSAMTVQERRGYAIGAAVECLVLHPRDRNGNLVLSLTQARVGQDWDRAEQYFEEATVFQAPISGHNKGGLIVYLGQVRGFVPASQIDRRHAIDRSKIDGTHTSPLAALVDEPMWFKIIEIDRRKNRLILSEQAAMRDRRKQLKTDLLNTLEEGQTVTGHVTSLADFGAFVDIGGADGLIHLSEISWNRVSHPREVLSINEPVTVKVIAVDRERKRIGLSLKQLEPEPWSRVAERFTVGNVIDGTITRLVDFGAFARLDGNIEGLIHVSEMTDDGRPAAEVVQPGDRVSVRVIRVDPDKKRIGLSLKRASPEFDTLGVALGNGAVDAETDVSPVATATGGDLADLPAATTGGEAETDDAGGGDLAAVEAAATAPSEVEAPDATPSEG